ncbi:MAG TPA: protein O-GlcNAcase, partial [Candidatus Limnocylindrales bacterium]
PFAVRGVLEGFYGNPWTHEQRLDLIAFIASRGMNTFVYTPKDDPLMRRDWRSTYEGVELRRLTELVNRCRASGVDFVFCVSPGLTMRYSDDDDVEALCDKLASIASLGVTSFGLLFDDIPPDLQHAEDREAFDSLADAHLGVANAVFERLPRGSRLTVCPTTYWGTGTEPYLATLGGGLEPGIDLFWTGRAICSPTLDVRDAATFERTARRPATYWDNYPVNDVAMGFELHIGPYRGRDPHLFRHAFGVVANGMELYEASKIPIATIADYLMAPEKYDAEKSWRRAMRDVVGDRDVDDFALFADNVRSSCLSPDDAPAVTRALETFAFQMDQGAGRLAASELGTLANRLLAAADHLLRGPVENRALIAECRPWIEAFETGAQALRQIAVLAAEGRLEKDAAELRPYLVRLRQARVRVFGDALDMTLADLTNTHVRPGELTLDAPGGGAA